MKYLISGNQGIVLLVGMGILKKQNDLGGRMTGS